MPSHILAACSDYGSWETLPAHYADTPKSSPEQAEAIFIQPRLCHTARMEVATCDTYTHKDPRAHAVLVVMRVVHCGWHKAQLKSIPDSARSFCTSSCQPKLMKKVGTSMTTAVSVFGCSSPYARGFSAGNRMSALGGREQHFRTNSFQENTICVKLWKEARLNIC